MYSGLLPVSDRVQDQSDIMENDQFYDPSIHDPLGLVSEEEALKLKLSVSEYNLNKFKYLMNTKQVHRVAEIALDKNFFSENPEFAHSGELPYLVLVSNEIDLLEKLLETGFNFPSSLIIRAIKEKNSIAMRTIVQMNLYSNNGLELAFWMMVRDGFIDVAQMILSQEVNIKDLFINYSLHSTEQIDFFIRDPEILNIIIKSALSVKEDLIACDILVLNPQTIDQTIVKRALENSCIETIKIIWSGNLVFPGQVKTSRAKRSPLWNKLNLDICERSERKKLNRMLRIPSILNNLLRIDKISEAAKVLDWPEACNEPGILHVLINYSQIDLIMKYVENTQVDISGSEFLEAYNKGFYKACIKMLRFKEPIGTLVKKNIQETLINLLDSGTTCLEAVEILSYINYRDWVTELTVDLCEHLDTLINESDELSACSSPILFCVLVVEFLHSISLNSIQNKHRCLECSESFVEQTFHFEKAIKDTEVLKFMLNERDCRGRSALVIMAENNMLKLLEGINIGAIVSKLWKGPDADNLWDASRLYNGITGEKFLAPVNLTPAYRFSFSVWIETCSIRSITGSISVILLLFVYNALIIQGIKYKNFVDLASETSTQSLLRISQILIVGLMGDLAMQYYFCIKTRRNFIFDAMRILDVVIFGQMLLILAGLQDNMGPGKKYSDTEPEIFVGLIHSFENLLVWIRVLLMLITTKRLGPFLFMIYHIMKKMVSFYFLFACFSIWFAAVFTALFSSSMPDAYGSFWISMRTLYSSSLGGFDFTGFEKSDKQILGALLLGLYLIITNIILLNLFIALFTTIYQQISEQVESTYRSAVILNYEKWRWDSKYGSLILYSTPFSFVGFLVTPILGVLRDPKNFNQRVSKIFYGSIYGVSQMLILIVIDLVLLPLVYVLGFYNYPKVLSMNAINNEGEGLNDSYEFSWKRLLIWAFCGIFILLFHILQDILTYWKILGTDYVENINIHPFATELNIRVMKEALKHIQENYVAPEEVANLWVYVKTLMTCEPELPLELSNALDFCVFFTLGTKDQRVNVRLMERILGNLDEKNLEKLTNIRVPFVSKGILNYRNLLGGVEVQGTVLPKKLGNPGGPVDIMNIENTYKIMKEMDTQIDYFAGVIKGLKEQAGILS